MIAISVLNTQDTAIDEIYSIIVAKKLNFKFDQL